MKSIVELGIGVSDHMIAVRHRHKSGDFANPV